MGFGKFLCVIGAVVAAPVVLPAAAAAGAAVAATAAGTAAAAAATVGTAVASSAVGTAAATVGSAVATSAVGTAVGGGMAVVGSGVGAAASAVGLTSVATVAGTTAGATAVGAITTSAAVGATSAVSGAGKMKEAAQMKEEAEQQYRHARTDFDKAEKATNEKLEELGKLKLEIWNSFDRFKVAFKKIRNMEDWEDLKEIGQLDFSEEELKEIELLAMNAKDLMKEGIVSAAGGQLAGIAISSGITSTAVASTGTAIASLHGAAAANASLAALGGGSLASGGLGMAGGAVVANTLAFAPAMAIGGLFLHSHGKKNLESAEKSMEESDRLVQNMEEAKKELKKLQGLAKKVEDKLREYHAIYCQRLEMFEALIERETDFNKYSSEEKKSIFVTCQVVSILKDMTLQQLLETSADGEPDKIRDKEISKCIRETDQRMYGEACSA